MEKGHSTYAMQDVELASDILVKSSYVTAFVGAGLSAESGVSTFRGAGGLWTKVGEPSPLGYKEFKRDPVAWWQMRFQAEHETEGPRAQFRMELEEAQPNPGHYALAALEHMGVLKYVITQNVDNLHFEAGSCSVAEIHGNRTKIRCIDCNFRLPRDDFLVFPDELPPRCPECRGIVKGDGVMFGEPIPTDVLEVCYKQTSMSDCMIVVGTSATVFPAASFPSAVWQDGGHLIEINPFETPLTHYSKVVLRGQSGEILPLLTEEVGRRLLKEEIYE